MKRMLDRNYHRIMYAVPSKTQDWLEKHLVCIDITNAAQWFIEESDQEYWDYYEDFPSVIPPWPIAWFEFINLDFIEKVSGRKVYDGLRAVGIRSWVQEIKRDRWREALEMDVLTTLVPPMESSSEDWAIRRELLTQHLGDGLEARWLALFSMVWEGKNKKIFEVGYQGQYLDPMGRPLNKVSLQGITLPGATSLSEPRQKQLGKEIQCVYLPFFFALSLLNCKNVYLEDIPASPIRKRKARKNKNRKEIVYKTLVIDAMRKQAKKEAAEDSQSSSIKKALHIVRGHFKDYRDSTGLFGKFHDIYWWEMHTRGDVSFGEIKKDYKVHIGEAND